MSCYKLAKFGARILGPLVGKSAHHIKNTQDFVKECSGLTMGPDESFTSYDVVALFTAIPPKDAIF